MLDRNLVHIRSRRRYTLYRFICLTPDSERVEAQECLLSFLALLNVVYN